MQKFAIFCAISWHIVAPIYTSKSVPYFETHHGTLLCHIMAQTYISKSVLYYVLYYVTLWHKYAVVKVYDIYTTLWHIVAKK